MKTRFSFIDPGMIMGVVIAIIILSVGVFAFFITLQKLPKPISYDGSTDWQNALANTSNNVTNQSIVTGNSVFNIIGVVMIIGAIMAIVGLVYNYVR